MSTEWDPAQYAVFAAERARPFHDLVSRITVAPPPAEPDAETGSRPNPEAAEGANQIGGGPQVVDLGCGTGELTATLCRRWPGAQVLGVDSSASMLARAADLAGPQLSFHQQSIQQWRPPEQLDVIVSNAALQWVPGHLSLLTGWLAALRPGGVLAIQVPAMSGSPAGEIFAAVAARPRWRDTLAGVSGPTVGTGGGVVASVPEYLDVLGATASRVEGWETTYHHVLPGDDPVLEWFSGSGLRPFLAALDEPARSQFRAEVAEQLRVAYPRRRYGTVLAFRRSFFIAYR